MPRTIPFAQYVFQRLRQLNCHSIHGVPGDFFLRALDYTRPAAGAGPRWIGNASELCAGYAADGYARAATQIARKRSLSFVPTVGALFTTYGVGELSAMNAIAGSYAESIPVVHLVATPSRRAMAQADARRPIHHSLGGTNMDVYAEMAKNITCAQAYLHKQDDSTLAAEAFDDVLEQAILKSKPVYATIPSDSIEAEVPTDMLDKPLILNPPLNDVQTQSTVIQTLLEKIRLARSPLVIADSLSYPLQLSSEINALVGLTGTRAMSYMSGKGIVNENLPSWYPALPNTTSESQSADLVMYFGPLLADTNTARWSAIPDSRDNVFFNLDTVEINDRVYHLRSKELLQQLLHRLRQEPLDRGITKSDNERYGFPGEAATSSRRAGRKITQDEFWPTMSSFLQPHDSILLANGTPLIGGRSLDLGENSTVVASSIWCSIGQMLPAAQGIAAAKADHGLPGRTILFEGDGSFQVTCQSISDIIRNKLDVTIFLVNNKGYTYERWLNGMHADYNDVPNWRYTDAGRFFGGSEGDVVTAKAENYSELLRILQDESTSDGKGLRLYEIIMDPEDVPEKSKPGLTKASEALRTD